MLFFMIGLPRSGKSTWCDKFVKCVSIGEKQYHNKRERLIDLDRLDNPRVVVSGDDIRKAITGERYNSHIEEYIFAIEHTMIKALLARGHDVIADDTHTTWKSIQSLLYLDPNAIPVWFPGDMFGKSAFAIPSDDFYKHVEICKERAVKTQQEDLLPVIDRMAKNLEKMYPEFDAKLEIYRNEARNHKHRIAQV